MLERAAQDARILIIDDQLANVAMLEALLQQAGYSQLMGITDSRTTIPVFRDFQPDLVLLDLLMPHLDGFEVMAQLRPLIAPDGFLPILVLTADITPETKRRALGDGAMDFLAKPLDTTEVLLRIRNLLHTRALHHELHRYSAALEQRVAERTRELSEARGEILGLYQELARRNQHLHELLDRVLHGRDADRNQAARAAHTDLSTPSLGNLTPREHEVLRLVAQGQTNAEIALGLVVSVATVKTHVEHIIAKLGVVDRTQAAVRAVEAGLVAPTSR